MLHLDQIHEAHARVKSGADFPAYVQALIALGLRDYTTYVRDGHIDYRGADGSGLQSTAKYGPLVIAEMGNKEQFAQRLKIHQQGQTDYPAFCRDSAAAGVEKWTVDMSAMTCTYYDCAGNSMLMEDIPQPK